MPSIFQLPILCDFTMYDCVLSLCDSSIAYALVDEQKCCFRSEDGWYLSSRSDGQVRASSSLDDVAFSIICASSPSAPYSDSPASSINNNPSFSFSECALFSGVLKAGDKVVLRTENNKFLYVFLIFFFFPVVLSTSDSPFCHGVHAGVGSRMGRFTAGRLLSLLIRSGPSQLVSLTLVLH